MAQDHGCMMYLPTTEAQTTIWQEISYDLRENKPVDQRPQLLFSQLTNCNRYLVNYLDRNFHFCR